MKKNEILEHLKAINSQVLFLISQILIEDHELETSINDPDYLPPAWRRHQDEKIKENNYDR